MNSNVPVERPRSSLPTAAGGFASDETGGMRGLPSTRPQLPRSLSPTKGRYLIRDTAHRGASSQKMLRLAISMLLVAAAALQLDRNPNVPRGFYDRPGLKPLTEIGASLGVPAPMKAPTWVWKQAWNVGHKALPILHRWDKCAPTDTNVNLWVCWLKAIIGNSAFGIDDRRLAYDLLPSVTRRVVSRPFASLYPLLHHQNVALRVAFLDGYVARALDDAEKRAESSPTVVVLGAGFDLRSLRLSEDVDSSSSSSSSQRRWAEIDLPHVIEQRQRLLNRLGRRRPQLKPQLQRLVQLPANLSIAEEARGALRTALGPSCSGSSVVFVVEALLIYLKPDDAAALLKMCAEEARAAGATSAQLCFADRLPHVPEYEVTAASALLKGAGFELDEDSWLPKPGLARHMGVARASFS